MFGAANSQSELGSNAAFQFTTVAISAFSPVEEFFGVFMNLEQNKPSLPKQPYSSPVIMIYGNIRQITQNVGNKGKGDGGGGVTSKTSA